MQRPSKRFGRIFGLTSATLLGASSLAAFPLGTASGLALPEATTFAFTGKAQNYLVPDGVCQVTIEASGAQGGAGVPDTSDDEVPEILQSPGGKGGVAIATITVTPGERLDVYVGGEGEAGKTFVNEDTQVDWQMSSGGWNGGGDTLYGAVTGGGGGGASDVRQGGNALSDRVVVGGGGGGVGGYNEIEDTLHALGGAGGNPATPGLDSQEKGEGVESSTGGGAGTESNGGSAGLGDRMTPSEEEPDSAPNGTAGALGLGGNGGGTGANSEARDFATGGGGGGGYYGGGGGGAGYESTGAGGGGGSSLGDETTPAMHTGNGEVVITPAAGCDSPTPTSTTAPTTTVPPAALPAKAVVAKPDYTG